MQFDDYKVLVIDDEIHIRQSFADFLEDQGFEVELAENGRIGLEYIKSMKPDLVLLDLRMPELDGLELLKEGKKIAPDTPMIVISGANQIGDVVRALRFGAWDYLEKPVQDFSILKHSVSQALEKAHLLNENRKYQKGLEDIVEERTRQVQMSQKHYRTLFEKNNDAIFVVEKRSGKFMDANNAASELTGRSIDDIINLNIKDVTSEPENIFSGGKDRKIDFTRPDGSIRTTELGTVPLDEDHIISIARDMTNDIEMERQLRQSQKMEAIGTLAGGIAHDFNNILSGIMGYAQLVKMDIPKDLIDKNIDQVLIASERAKDLVQQILTFSRKADNKKRELKLYLVVKEALKFLRSSIPKTIDIEEGIISKSSITADATQMHQVVMNLCTNAYHAMGDKGGKLTVTLTDSDINGKEAEKYIKLKIQDTGQGIEKEHLERIFDPYFSTKKLTEGTGLGLAVVDGIVKKHRGFIEVKTKYGEGTEFNVFFPAISEKKDEKAKKDTSFDNYSGSENIMLVEDEEAILLTTRMILEKMGYKVAPFINAEEALESFKRSPSYYDLVITDMAMPKMKGTILAEEIKKIRDDIPVILCSGYYGDFEMDTARKSYISRFVQKPVIGKDLAMVIREELKKSKDNE